MKNTSLFSVIIILFILQSQLSGQIVERKEWCISKCNSAGDEMVNTKALFGLRGQNIAETRSGKTTFPLRIGIVGKTTTKKITKSEIEKTIAKLNKGFGGAGIDFTIDRIDYITSPYTIEVLSDRGYSVYNDFAKQYDDQKMISIYFFDYDSNLCTSTPTSISCGRTGGFSYILSRLTNSLVLSKFDLEDDKVIVHEMAHFFGLYHTHEEDQFGKDDFGKGCDVLGDCLCDTPPDPGPAYEVYVNNSKCEMQGFFNEKGNEYKPDINNYMSYFKPCYLQEYSFTPQQLNILKLSAGSEFRSQFSR
jgi:hypothetical protein